MLQQNRLKTPKQRQRKSKPATIQLRVLESQLMRWSAPARQ